VTVVEDASGVPLEVGRRSRTIPAALRRALHLRDRGCVYPGCENRRVDGHHVKPWSRGGATELTNLASLCRRHHRYIPVLVAQNVTAGIAIDRWANLPRWDGTPPDYDHIVHTLATNHPPPPSSNRPAPRTS
jgi:hypothetical protein